MEIDLMFDSGWICAASSRYRLVMVQWQQRREKRGVAADGAPPDVGPSSALRTVRLTSRAVRKATWLQHLAWIRASAPIG
jgi:hypothetical protein